jgi:ubiquinone/menaquinone biosynthesis C-methylase UbiE
MADKDFTGSVPGNYDRFLGPLLFVPYAADMARRLAGFEGELLEVAAGTGIVTEALDRALPAGARIVATDLNQAMVDHAAAKGFSSRVRWQTADGQALPFADAAFEAVVCQFGVMFFPDRVQGFREARRVLKSGGRYLFNVWDSLADNEEAEITHEAVAALFPDDPPGFLARTPFGYSDKDRIRADLAAAGFTDVDIETVRETGRAASARDIAVGYCEGSPLGGEIKARDPEGVPRAVAATTAALERRYGGGPLQLPLQALVVTARR